MTRTIRSGGAVQRPGHGGRIRGRPHQISDSRGHAGGQGQGSPAGQAAQAEPASGSALVELLYSGEYSTAELGDLFGVARSTVYRAVARSKKPAASGRNAIPAPTSRVVQTVTVSNYPSGINSTSTITYRPRHGAASELPSENRGRSHARTARPASPPQTGR